MNIDRILERRVFLKHLSMTAGGVLLLPHVTSCSTTGSAAAGANAAEPASGDVPVVRPDNWDPIAFNRARGNAGAIPESYHASINGPDGVTAHLGKHLPYWVEADDAPEGYKPVMWGDPAKGHAMHPNARPDESNNNEGHWYNWIKVRKAVAGEAQETKSTFSGWPSADEGDSGRYLALGGDIEAENGKNTIYLIGMPSDLAAGDTVRIWAHCLTHGEYVDFLTV